MPTPWDRLGSFFGDMATVTATIANRNMELWMTPPRDADGGYGTAGMPADWSRWTEIAMRNTQDIWALWLGLSPRERVAYPVPTVYLEIESYVDEDGDTRWIAFDPVWIPVGWAAVERLPERAHVELSGQDAKSAQQLARRLRVRLGSGRMAYVLEGHDMRRLSPGAYAGMVFVDHPTRLPLAALRIVVRGEPTDTDPPQHGDSDLPG
jgi:hypothetical protein